MPKLCYTAFLASEEMRTVVRALVNSLLQAGQGRRRVFPPFYVGFFSHWLSQEMIEPGFPSVADTVNICEGFGDKCQRK